MAPRMMMMIDAGGFIVGVILLVVGWGLTPDPPSFVFPGPINVAGQSMIALGLAFIVVSVGFLLAGFEERMMSKMD